MTHTEITVSIEGGCELDRAGLPALIASLRVLQSTKSLFRQKEPEERVLFLLDYESLHICSQALKGALD